MNKNRKTSHILNVFQYDDDGHVVLPASLTLTIAPASDDNSGKVGTTAWIRSYVTGLSYLTTSSASSTYVPYTGATSNLDLGVNSVTAATVNSAVFQNTSNYKLELSTIGIVALTNNSSTWQFKISGELEVPGDVVAGSYAGNRVSLQTGAHLQSLRDGYIELNAGVSGAETARITFTSNGSLGLGTTPNYGTSGQFLTSGGTGGAISWTTVDLSSYATQSYVGTQIANLVASAPTTLDTLNELATALGNDANFSTTITTSIGTKVPQARTLTINGTAYDLTADRSWTITSMIYPGAGIAVSTGTAWGTSITNNSTNWNTAYGWGNHASAGYLTSVTNISGNAATSTSTNYFTLNSGADIESVTSGGIYRQESPSSGYNYTTTLNMNSSDGRQQLTIARGGDGMKFRGTTTGSGTSWNAWKTVIDSSNIGSQSVSYATTSGSATSAGSVSGLTLNNSGSAINPDSVTQNQIGYDTSVDLFGQGDGGLYSSAYNSSWIHQIHGDFRTGQIAIRGKNSGTWQAWRTVLDTSNAGYAFLMNQYVRTSDSPGFVAVSGNDVYTTGGWFRNHTNSNGIYWSATGWHLMPHNSSDFRIHSGTSDCSLRMERNGTVGGYIHCASDNAIGFLNTGRGWSLRVDNAGGGTFYGGLTVKNAIYLDANEDLYLNYNYGCSIVGVYSASRFQGVFSMGNSWKLARDGTSPGNLYGLSWSHPNAGGQAGYLNNHGLLVMVNGQTETAIATGIWTRGDVTAYSDARVKDNVEVIENAVEKVKAIRGVTFTRNDRDDKTKRFAGVIAQEVLEVLPEVVTEDALGTYSVAYGNLNALLIEAIKEQQNQIDELKSIISGLTK
jgi:hypothetical protein